MSNDGISGARSSQSSLGVPASGAGTRMRNAAAAAAAAASAAAATAARAREHAFVLTQARSHMPSSNRPTALARARAHRLTHMQQQQPPPTTTTAERNACARAPRSCGSKQQPPLPLAVFDTAALVACRRRRLPACLHDCLPACLPAVDINVARSGTGVARERELPARIRARRPTDRPSD